MVGEYKHHLHVPIYMYMYISVLYLRSIIQYTSNAIVHVIPNEIVTQRYSLVSHIVNM